MNRVVCAFLAEEYAAVIITTQHGWQRAGEAGQASAVGARAREGTTTDLERVAPNRTHKDNCDILAVYSSMLPCKAHPL
jgi:hypothetical protein